MVKIVDGDTIWIDEPAGRVKVRLLGIDTPETKAPGTPVQCFGPEATVAAKRFLAGTRVWITTDPSQDTYDRYGRLLAYVWVDDDLINLDLISGGYAAEYTYEQPYRYWTRSEPQKAPHARPAPASGVPAAQADEAAALSTFGAGTSTSTATGSTHAEES